jgi:hypothetical protein
MGEVTISVRHGPGPVSFEFATSMGGVPQVSDVLVIDDPHTDELWEISAVKWKSVRTSGKAHLQERLHAARLTLPGGMEPLADFDPEDPRYRIAKEIMDDGFRAASTELRSLTYGSIPGGFEQTTPEQGAAVGLVPGRRYKVVLLGRDFGSLVFAAA